MALYNQVNPIEFLSVDNNVHKEQEAYKYKPAIRTKEERQKQILHIQRQIMLEREREWREDFHRRRDKNKHYKNKSKTSTKNSNESESTVASGQHSSLVGVSDLSENNQFKIWCSMQPSTAV